MFTNQEELETVVCNLGTTADRVAQALKAHHITGRRGQPHSCPIANYVKEQCGLPLADVSASPLYLGITYRKPNEDVGYFEIPTPEPVAQFITFFDHNHYPDLDILKQP